jgi:hypothetical protein
MQNAKCKEAETAFVGSTRQADASYPQDMQRAATRNACLPPGIMFFFLDSRISQTFIYLLARIQKS